MKIKQTILGMIFILSVTLGKSMNRIIVRSSIILSGLCTVLFIASIITSCAGISPDLKNIDTGNKQDIMASLIDMITGEMKTKKITGLSIAVADSEGLLWTEGLF